MKGFRILCASTEHFKLAFTQKYQLKYNIATAIRHYSYTITVKIAICMYALILMTPLPKCKKEIKNENKHHNEVNRPSSE